MLLVIVVTACSSTVPQDVAPASTDIAITTTAVAPTTSIATTTTDAGTQAEAGTEPTTTSTAQTQLRQERESMLQGGDHWHLAYGIYDCRTESFTPNLVEARQGSTPDIHTHDDGVIHIHPDTQPDADAVTLGGLFDASEAELSDDELAVDGYRALVEGGICDGDPAILQVARFARNALEPTEVITNDLRDVRFLDAGESFVLMLAPEGSDVPAPPFSNVAAALAAGGWQAEETQEVFALQASRIPLTWADENTPEAQLERAFWQSWALGTERPEEVVPPGLLDGAEGVGSFDQFTGPEMAGTNIIDGVIVSATEAEISICETRSVSTFTAEGITLEWTTQLREFRFGRSSNAEPWVGTTDRTITTWPGFDGCAIDAVATS